MPQLIKFFFELKVVISSRKKQWFENKKKFVTILLFSIHAIFADVFVKITY